jgi:uncharacterized membrane protein
MAAAASVATSQLRWAASGWILFIAENAILSENRTYLIEKVGDNTYHQLYGLCSTAATGSIGYAYYKIRTSLKPVPPVRMVQSWVLLTTGLIMASQTLPSMQIPVASSGQVRCPFDFDHGKEHGSQLHGLERITRHAGLWSLAFCAGGNALVQPTRALTVWWWGPAAVAWLGGMHTDSRFRRNMGGTLDPQYDSVTSNVPFVAMLSGKQGSQMDTFRELAKELKPLNAGVAAILAMLITRRLR